MTARPGFTTREAMDVYIALLRAATSRRQSDAEFATNAAKAASFAPDDDELSRADAARLYASRIAAGSPITSGATRCASPGTAFFEDWDVLLCPAAASAAFPHDQVGERHERTILVNGKRVPTTDQLFWAGYSGCFYLPATVAPIGLTPQGLPCGRADRCAAIWRFDLPALRRTARTRLCRLRAAARLPLNRARLHKRVNLIHH